MISQTNFKSKAWSYFYMMSVIDAIGGEDQHGRPGRCVAAAKSRRRFGHLRHHAGKVHRDQRRGEPFVLFGFQVSVHKSVIGRYKVIVIVSNFGFSWLLFRPPSTLRTCPWPSGCPAWIHASQAGAIKLSPEVLAKIEVATNDLKQAMGSNADLWQGKGTGRVF